jgi:AraC-like DNA-binding protein
VPPKRLARIIRFTNALRTLDTLKTADRGTRTAADHGYADQAHFARDFREFAGCSPTAHLLNRAELTGFFTQDRLAYRAS